MKKERRSKRDFDRITHFNLSTADFRGKFNKRAQKNTLKRDRPKNPNDPLATVGVEVLFIYYRRINKNLIIRVLLFLL